MAGTELIFSLHLLAPLLSYQVSPWLPVSPSLWVRGTAVLPTLLRNRRSAICTVTMVTECSRGLGASPQEAYSLQKKSMTLRWRAGQAPLGQVGRAYITGQDRLPHGAQAGAQRARSPPVVPAKKENVDAITGKHHRPWTMSPAPRNVQVTRTDGERLRRQPARRTRRGQEPQSVAASQGLGVTRA